MRVVEDESHNYVFSELQPKTFDGEFYKQPYFRFLILFKRKEGITEEWFYQHWSSVHADMTMAMKGAGMRLSRYVQVRLQSSGEYSSTSRSVLNIYDDSLELAMSSCVPSSTGLADSPSQFHQDQIHKEQIVSMLTNGMAIAPYDGIAEFYAKDTVHLKKFFSE